MKVNKDASDKAFGKVDLDYFVQSSIDNAANEEELDTEVKIFQNALDFSNIKIRDCIVPRTEVVAVDLTTSLDELKSRFIESGSRRSSCMTEISIMWSVLSIRRKCFVIRKTGAIT